MGAPISRGGDRGLEHRREAAPKAQMMAEHKRAKYDRSTRQERGKSLKPPFIYFAQFFHFGQSAMYLACPQNNPAHSHWHNLLVSNALLERCGRGSI